MTSNRQILIPIEYLNLKDNMVDNGIEAVIIHAYIRNFSEFFGGYVGSSPKKLSSILFGTEELTEYTEKVLNWLEEHGYINSKKKKMVAEDDTEQWYTITQYSVTGRDPRLIWDEYQNI